jgi:hypothetical protein
MTQIPREDLVEIVIKSFLPGLVFECTRTPVMAPAKMDIAQPRTNTSLNLHSRLPFATQLSLLN